jgi:hypothetical protein
MRTVRIVGVAAYLALLATGLLVAPSAMAAVITFDEISLPADITVPGSFNPVQTAATFGGFNFTGPHFHIINNTVLGQMVDNGTQYAAFDPPLGQPITMTKVGGGLFALNAFDGAEVYLDGAPGLSTHDPALYIHVVGNLSDGSTLATDFMLDGLKDGPGGIADFQTFLFSSSWNDLVSVIWSGQSAAGAPGTMSFDNVVVTSVPEPFTLSLFGTGLAGVIAMRRGKKSAS